MSAINPLPAGAPPNANAPSLVPPVRLTLLPTAVALLLLAVSIVLSLLVVTGMDTDATLPWAIVGYVLAPFCTSACLIWARAIDLRNQSKAGYLKLDGHRRLRLLGVVALVSFVPALAFIWYIASYVGSVLA